MGILEILAIQSKKKKLLSTHQVLEWVLRCFQAEGIVSRGSGKDNVYIRVNSLMQWFSNWRVH